MAADEWARRGSSFGTAASAYADLRAGYPADAVRWSLACLGPDISGLRVVDLGAGTGILTGQLAGLGADVTAVEPDENMRAEFRRRLPTVPLLAGSAEDIPLPDGSADAVLCGQAMHWFNLNLALPEIARVLRGDGVLAGLWNDDDDRVEWVAGMRAAAEGSMGRPLSERRSEVAALLAGRFDPRTFSAPETAEFPNAQRSTAESLTGVIGTHSRLLVMPAAERDRILANVGDYLRGRAETSAGEFTYPMITLALRTTRAAAGAAGL